MVDLAGGTRLVDSADQRREGTRAWFRRGALLLVLAAAVWVTLDAMGVFGARPSGESPEARREGGTPEQAPQLGEDGGSGDPAGSQEPAHRRKPPAPDASRGHEALIRWLKTERGGWKRPEKIDTFVTEQPERLMDLLSRRLQLARQGDEAADQTPRESEVIDGVIRSFGRRHPRARESEDSRSFLGDELTRSREMSDGELLVSLGLAASLGVSLSAEQQADLWREVERRAMGHDGARLIHALSLVDMDADVATLAAVYLVAHPVEVILKEGMAFGQPPLAARIALGVSSLPVTKLDALRASTNPDLSFFGFITGLANTPRTVPDSSDVLERSRNWRENHVSAAAHTLLVRFGQGALDTVRPLLQSRARSRVLHYQAIVDLDLGYNRVQDLLDAIERGDLVWSEDLRQLVPPT